MHCAAASEQCNYNNNINHNNWKCRNTTDNVKGVRFCAIRP